MQNQLININQNMTMSSLEIVKVINAIRKSDGDNTELQHKHVLDKIKLILPNSAEFLAQYKDSTGRALPCYNLPKRESILLTMSYSYKVQAAVYDAWEKLENQQSLTVFGHDTSTHRGALLALVASLDKIEADTLLFNVRLCYNTVLARLSGRKVAYPTTCQFNLIGYNF